MIQALVSFIFTLQMGLNAVGCMLLGVLYSALSGSSLLVGAVLGLGLFCVLTLLVLLWALVFVRSIDYLHQSPDDSK